MQISESNKELRPISVPLRKKNRKLIAQADLICYPPGSFFSSLIANLLPKGVGEVIAENRVPKVYIPNLGNDPEQFGRSMEENIATLLQTLREDSGSDCPSDRLLNYLVIDSHRGSYGKLPRKKFLKKHGVQLIDARLLLMRREHHYNPGMINREIRGHNT